MGLFNRLGRNVERFAQDAKAAAADEAEYECRACGARFHADRDRCSECGSTDLVRVDRTDGTDGDDEESREREE